MCKVYDSLRKRIKNFLYPLWYLLRNIIRCYRMGKVTNNLPYIENGHYKLLLSYRTIIYKEEAAEFVKQFEIVNAGKFKRLQNMQITIKDKKVNSMFGGQVVIMTSNNECKIFDLKHMQVMSFMDEAAKKKFHETYDIFHEKLKMTYMFDTNEGIVEKIIHNIPRNAWSRKMVIENYFRILDDQLNYLNYTSKTGKMTGEDIWNEIQNYQFKEINEIGERIMQRIECTQNIPCVVQHRDMHFGNTLFDGKDLYYIDFEYAGSEIFLYDIFNCIFVDVMLNYDKLLLSLYIRKNAEMFNYMHRIFDAVGMVFNEERYMEYIYYFLLARLKFICVMSSRSSSKKEQRRLSHSQKKYFSTFCDYLEELYEE